MKTVSLVMIAKNEAAVIGRCLESVKMIVDEIIVVDTGSTDETKSIAQSYGAKVFEFIWSGSFSEARNFSLQQSTCTWSLVLDADEWISNDCLKALKHFINGPEAIGRITLIDKFKGMDGDSYSKNFISRLFPSYLRYAGRIHEQLISDLPRHNVEIICNHDGYYSGGKAQRNIPMLQKTIEEHPESSYYHYQLGKEFRGANEPKAAYFHFMRAYQLGNGDEPYFPNTVVDLVYAAIETNELEEIYDLVQKERSRWHDFSDMHFVNALYYLELIMHNTPKYLHLMPEIERCYEQCLLIGENNKYSGVLGTGSYSAYHNLGVYYEVIGNVEKAMTNYAKAAQYNYAPSINRLKLFNV